LTSARCACRSPSAASRPRAASGGTATQCCSPCTTASRLSAPPPPARARSSFAGRFVRGRGACLCAPSADRRAVGGALSGPRARAGRAREAAPRGDARPAGGRGSGRLGALLVQPDSLWAWNVCVRARRLAPAAARRGAARRGTQAGAAARRRRQVFARAAPVFLLRGRLGGACVEPGRALPRGTRRVRLVRKEGRDVSS